MDRQISPDETSPGRTRIAGCPAWLAWLILLLAVGLSLSTLGGPPDPPPLSNSTAPAAQYTDRELYREIVRRVGQGQDYYAAAGAAQRAHGYPTAPPWAFREPTEAWLLALLATDAVRWGALLLLAAVTVVLVRRAQDRAPGPSWRRIAATLLFGVGLATVAVPAAPYLHENWAALLIGLSLACWRPGDGRAGGRFGLAVAFGLLACLFREIALPYLLAMTALAAAERRRSELLAWSLAVAVLAGALGVHFALAARQHLPGDGVSPGWLRFGGWPFAVLAARRNVILAVLPAPLASLVLLASLLGLGAARSPWLNRVAASAAAFLVVFAAVGRPDNYYWGMIVAPLLAMGLPFAPAALLDLAKAAIGRGRAVKPAA